MNRSKITLQGIKEVLQRPKYSLLFVGAFLVTLYLLILIPALSVPGNSFFLQLTLFTPLGWTLISFIALLYALFMTMQIYVFRNHKKMAGVGASVGGGVSVLFAGVASSAFCVSCLAPLFALFGIGFGGVLFVLEYRFYFVVVIVVLMAISIYLTAKKINRVC